MKASYFAALLGFGASASALEQKCSGTVCYSLSIPDATASSGSGDIYMQITGPTSYSWIGLGQGNQMAGAQMYVIYANSGGSNVTLSPRLGTGNVMPQYNSNAKVSLLAGSGISNGMMTANIKCTGCNSWNGGSMDFSSSSTGWIYAALSGNALNSDSTSATIRQHSGNAYGTMSFSSKARGGSSSNPFLASNSASGTSTAASGSSTTPTGAAASASGSPTSGASQIEPMRSGRMSRREMILIAHGVLAGTAFAILFPLGAMTIRLLSFKGVVLLHSVLQAISLVVFTVAFGLGVWVATNSGELGEYHPIIGIIVFALLLLQPLLGVAHHGAYKKTGGRTFWSHAHIWLGRIVITLGIINGGLGFLLADNTTYGPIAYGVVAGVFYLAYLASIYIGERRRKQTPGAPSKMSQYDSYGGNSATLSPVPGVQQDHYSNRI